MQRSFSEQQGTPIDLYDRDFDNESRERQFVGEIYNQILCVKEIILVKCAWASNVAIVINQVVWHAVRIVVQSEGYFVASKLFESFSYPSNQTISTIIEILRSDEPLVELLSEYPKYADEFFFNIPIGKKRLLANLTKLELGTWIRVVRGPGLYTHDCLYIGEDRWTGNYKIVHYAGNRKANCSESLSGILTSDCKSSARIREDNIDRFIDKSDKFLIRTSLIPGKNPQTIVKHAKMVANSHELNWAGEYDLAGRNCQHAVCYILGVPKHSPSQKTITFKIGIYASYGWLMAAAFTAAVPVDLAGLLTVYLFHKVFCSLTAAKRHLKA
jgi:hypothetical protein